MFAQSEFSLRWDSEVGCLLYGERDKGVPFEDIEASDCLRVCERSIVEFELIFDDEEQQVSSISWFTEGGDIQNISPEHTEAVIEFPNEYDDGEVTIVIDKENGEVIYKSICVNVKANPVAEFEILGSSETGYCSRTDLYFNNLSTAANGSQIVSYFWRFGDGFSSSEKNPVHSYNEPGTYFVTLYVKDECNCTHAIRQRIEVLPESLIIKCPTVTCEGKMETYTVDINPKTSLEEINCSEFNFDVEGGEVVDQTENQITVIWNEVGPSGFGNVFFDQTNCELECQSQIAARIPVVQQNGTIQGGKSELCAGEQSRYALPQWPTTDFQWELKDDNGNSYPNALILVDQRNEIAVSSSGLSTGQYTLISNYTNTLHNCSGSAEYDIQIFENLAIADHESKICEGDQITFDLVDAVPETNWEIVKNGETIVTSTGNSISYNFDDIGSYNIVAEADGYCNASSSINVYEIPEIPSGLEIDGNDEMCPGQGLTYTLNSSIVSQNIVWDVVNGSIVGPNDQEEVNIIFDEGFNDYEVSLRLVNSSFEECVSNTLSKNVEVKDPDVDIINTESDSTGPLEFCASSTSNFSIDYQDTDVYTWSFQPAELANVSSGQGTSSPEILFNETFIDENGVEQDSGTISVAAKVCGEMQVIDTFDFSITESPQLTVTNDLPDDDEVCAGVPFSMNITSSLPLSISDPSQDISLSFDNAVSDFGNITVNSQTSITINDIVLDNVDSEVSTAYNVSIENQNCNTATASGTLDLKPSPIVNLSIQSGGTSFCDPDEIDTVLEVNIQDPNGNETYKWFYNGSAIPGVSNTTSTLNIGSINDPNIDFGSYSVQVYNQNTGCAGSTNVIEVVQDCEEPELCETGESVLVNASWTECNEVEVTIDYTGSPTNIITESPDNFTNNNSTLINETTNQGLLTRTYNVTATGNYIFKNRVIYGDCQIKKTVSVEKGYDADLLTDITCNGNNSYDVTLINNASFLDSYANLLNVDYTITNTDTGQDISVNESFLEGTANLSPGNYEFTIVLDIPGFPVCTATEDVELSLPDASFSLANLSFCTEENVVLSPDNPNPDHSYLWEFQDASNTLQNITPNLNFKDNTTISLTVTDAYGCSDTFSINGIEVLEADLEGNIFPQDGILCQGESLTLNFNNPPTQTINSYQWIRDGVDINGATGQSLNVTDPGNYWVRLTDENGCVYNEVPGVFVNEAPAPSISVSANSQVCAGNSFSISGVASPDNTEYQIWEVVNGQENILQSWQDGPDIDFDQSISSPGDYEFRLQVRDTQYGCETNQYFPINVLPDNQVNINTELLSCEPYKIRLSVDDPEQDALYTWSNGEEGESIVVNSGGPYQVTYQPATNGCTASRTVLVPRSVEEFLWIFPDGCFEYCSAFDRPEPPYIIGPIPEFNEYAWGFNGDFNSASGQVEDFELLEELKESGQIQLRLYNDLQCGFTSSPLNTELDGPGCEANCDIEMDIGEAFIIDDGPFIKYGLNGLVHNPYSFDISVQLLSEDGIYSPEFINIPPNSSYDLGANNVMFVPDAGFNGGNSDIYLRAYNNDSGLFCRDGFDIEYPFLDQNSNITLNASPNPVNNTTYVHFQIKGGAKSGNASIRVFDLSGNLKQDHPVNSAQGKKRIDLSGYASGQYMVVFYYEGKVAEQISLIKK